MVSKIRFSVTRVFLLLERPLFAFLFAFIAYFLLSCLGGNPFRVTSTAYFNYLADAFLHGQLSLRLLTRSVHDLSFFQGRYYLYWPPMPAVILMPFVAIFGVAFSDIFFNVLVGAANVAAVAALLRSADRLELVRIDPADRALLVLFFAFGTVHLILALFGRVWFTAQLLGFLFVALAYLSAIELRGAQAFLVTGVLLACAMLTRNHLIFTGLWPAFYLLTKYWQEGRKLFLYSTIGLIPVLVLGGLFLGYNFLRFGNPLELGIRYHKMASLFVHDYQTYGAFNFHYLPANFYYQYIYYPFPVRKEIWMGGSLFLLSPVFLYAFKGLISGFRTPSVWLWLLSVLATSIPILLLMGTGWIQFGPRYTLDFTVPLLLLTARGVRSASKPLLAVLVAISIVQYAAGMILFSRLHL